MADLSFDEALSNWRMTAEHDRSAVIGMLYRSLDRAKADRAPSWMIDAITAAIALLIVTHKQDPRAR